MNKKEIKAYNGVRAIAMLGVLLYHVFPSLFPGGYLGVVTFFTMAGFFGLISLRRKYDRLRIKEAPGVLASDLSGRVKRLFPEMLFMLTLCLLFMLLVFPDSLRNNLISFLGAITFTNHLTQIAQGQSYFDQVGILKPFTHLWALGIEFQFHLFLGLLFFVLHRLRRKKMIGLILPVLIIVSYLYMRMIYGMGAQMTRVYYDPVARFFSYGIGAFCVLFVTKKGKAHEEIGVMSAIALAFMIASYFVFGISDFVFYAVFLAYSIAAGVLMCDLYHAKSVVANLLEFKALQILGERSYSVYLWHYPILKFTEKIFAHIQVSSALYYLLYFVLTAALSEASYRLFRMLEKDEKKRKLRAVFVLVMLTCGLAITAVGFLNQKPTELDAMRRMILENEKEMAQQAKMQSAQTQSAQTPFVEVPAASGQGSGVSVGDLRFETEQMKAISKYLPKLNIHGYLSHVFRLLYGESASEFQERFYKSFTSQSSSEASKKEEAPETAVPVEKSASHLKAESYIQYVNEFGEKVYLDLDQYAKYRLTKLLIIGDSIASMSYHTMQLYMPEAIIDGSHSRQFDGAYETYRKHLKESGGDIGDFVVLSLGTNGAVKHEDIDKVRKELDGRKLILISIVLPYKGEEESRNEQIYAYAEKYDDVYLADWHDVAKNQKKWFFEDNIHPGENGAKVYSQLIIKKVIEIMEGR